MPAGEAARPHLREGLRRLADAIAAVVEPPLAIAGGPIGIDLRPTTLDAAGVPMGVPAAPTLDVTLPSLIREPVAAEPALAPIADTEAWDLVGAAQGGDVDAFGRLYDRYVDTVYRFIYYRLGDRAHAEDLTSETFMRALRRLHSLKNQGRDPAAWFVTIARNLVLDHVKSARYRLEVTAEDAYESSYGSPATDSAETTVLTVLTNERLVEAIQELSDEQRECVVLRFLHGFSVAETAEVMGKNDGSIKALQHRAVRRLHTLLKDELI
jgi:RNA polymerase sigma-70 factor (TIGR02952 family)